MTFQCASVGIYSVGLLGGSIGLALKTSGFSGTITGFSSPVGIKTALQTGCIDKGYNYDALERIIPTIDLLFLCSPINTIIETIKVLSGYKLPDGLVITDIGSTKRKIMNEASQLPANINFIGGHPMAGSEKSGPAAADPYLFENAVYAVTPCDNVAQQVTSSFSQFLQKYLGCRTLELDSSVHDTIVAAVSHIPHLLAVALVNHARQIERTIPGTLALAAGGFRDMTRIASTEFPMWKDIFETNLDIVDTQLDQMVAILHDVKSRLHHNSLQCLFDNAKDTRSKISPGNKGFATQLHDIYIIAPDQPGVIATLSSALARHSINIKDFEVLKVRENEGGTIRIAFDSATTARTALSLIRELGFQARERT